MPFYSLDNAPFLRGHYLRLKTLQQLEMANRAATGNIIKKFEVTKILLPFTPVK